MKDNNRFKKRVKKDVTFTIDFKEINKVIELIKKRKTAFYDPFRRTCFVDDIELSDAFLNDVTSKFSHFINAVCNLRNSIQLGSVDAYIESQDFPSVKNKEKDIKKSIEIDDMIEKGGDLVDKDGKTETYE